MNPLFCFACLHSFCVTCYTVFISTHVFSHFFPTDPLLHPTGRERVSSCVGLGCQLGLKLNTWKSESRLEHPCAWWPQGGSYSVWTGDSNSLVHAGAFRRSYAGFPLGNLLSLRTSRASATRWQPPSPTDFKKRKMALQDPDSSTHSQKTTSTRTLSVCAYPSGGCTHFV